MPPVTPPESSPYRVTLFFGPETVAERLDTVACVFNVKKRSWKAGVQVTVEINKTQLSVLAEALQLTSRLEQAFKQVDAESRAGYEARVPDLFAQAVCWCKLDLQLDRGITQDNHQFASDDPDPELHHTALFRKAYVLTYILTELDLAVDNSCT